MFLETVNLMPGQFSYDFEGWDSLNDDVMGGTSQAICIKSSIGLILKGSIVEENGGFVSCKSPIFEPPIDLSSFKGLELKVYGQGRILKFTVSCKAGLLDFSEYILNISPGGLLWFAEFETNAFGSTILRIPFKSLEPIVTRKTPSLPVNFKPNSINQFQLLHSKFGRPGKLNPGFRPGKIKIVLESISAYS